MSEIVREPNESPTLRRGIWFWLHSIREESWICDNMLSTLFKIPNDHDICLFSACEPTPDTYRVRLTRTMLVLPDISEDRIEILPTLHGWLEQQIAQGRPHIGVYIIH
jgi:hypothetical protein